MKIPPPIRAHLKRGPMRARAAARAFQDLQGVLAREYLTDADLCERIINHEDEMLPWMMVRQEGDRGHPSRAREVGSGRLAEGDA